MPVLDSYLFFNGNCAEAMRFYAEVLDAPVTAMMRYGDAPDLAQCPALSADRIMHASLVVDGRNLMASDYPVGQEKPMSGFSLSLFYDEPAQARRIFDALAAGGTVVMPLAETFWARACGMLVDRFGTHWMVGGRPKPLPQG